MDRADLVALLKPGVPEKGGRWADLGAGEGAFTLALAELLGSSAHIIAVDKDARALSAIGHGIETRVADFTRPLDLHDLDGVVMANSLHFVRNKAPVLEAVRDMLRPGGRLIVVEYSGDRGNPWVPHPFTYPTWVRMAETAGLQGTELLHSVPSRYFGSMYSALSRRPAT
ncbi:MAG TPA: methyltransferase domain-containing protein [Candidatus Dormibacteraeota bacterium]|nr:methyltransferase domain-containing protein [Candidatus Dormibacteraeota bacterium]